MKEEENEGLFAEKYTLFLNIKELERVRESGIGEQEGSAIRVDISLRRCACPSDRRPAAERIATSGAFPRRLALLPRPCNS